MTEKIKIIIVGNKNTTQRISSFLSLEGDIEVLKELETGREAISLSQKLSPDILLTDIDLPDMEAISLTETISIDAPSVAVIIISDKTEQEYFRKAMMVGARDYLTKPYSPDEVISSIRRVKKILQKKDKEKQEKKGKIITVFGTKGGVGKSLIASNLAVGIKQITQSKVAIIDLDLQFGDIAIMLNLAPTHTISDLSLNISNLDIEALEGFLTDHSSGVKLLAAPVKPVYAEYVNPTVVEKILKLLKEQEYIVVVDTAGEFLEVTLQALELSDIVFLVTTLDLPTIKNSKLALDTLKSLNYPQEKIKIILNRSDSHTGLTNQHLQDTLGFNISATIPSDGKLVIPSVNEGKPFILTSPTSEISKSILKLASSLFEKSATPVEKKTEPSVSPIFKFLKPLFSKK